MLESECGRNGADVRAHYDFRSSYTGILPCLNHILCNYKKQNFTQLKNGTDEYAFGAAAFLDRHPAVTSWLRTHSFYLCKLDIQSVVVLDWYGGPHVVPVDEYFNVKP